MGKSHKRSRKSKKSLKNRIIKWLKPLNNNGFDLILLRKYMVLNNFSYLCGEYSPIKEILT